MSSTRVGRFDLRPKASACALALLTLVLPATTTASTDVISREVTVKVLPVAPIDVISREVTVKVLPVAPTDVVSREVSVYLPGPDLVVSNPIIQTASVARGAFLQVDWSVTNTGGEAVAPTWSDAVYLSADSEYGNADDLLVESVPWTGDLLPGDQYQVKTPLWVPLSIPAQTYFVYVHADHGGVLTEEWSELDNIALAAGMVTILPAGTYTDPDYIAADDDRLDGLDVIVDGSTSTVDGTHTFASLELRDSATLTHSGAFEGGLDLTVLGDVLVTADSAIDVSGKGYPADTGPGVGTPVYTGIATGNSKHGGGHGGFGASSSTDESSYAPSYGSLFAPRTLGSGGFSGSSFGGGAVALHVGGTLTLEGDIHSDGLPKVASSGGGAGGSVWITATNLVGAGSITAEGGRGETQYPFNAGGGGGGRVHLVTADTSGYSGSVQAFGGYGSSHGGAGPVVLEDTTLGTRELVLRNFQPGLSIAGNPLAWGPTTLPSSVSFDSVVLDDGVRLRLERPTFGLRLGVTGDMVLGAGAAIWGSELGFGDGEGPGAGATQAGGGYGGFGGGSNPGAMYGEPVLPVLAGSGGGGYAGPSLGGGAFVLEVGGDLQFDGLITVNGSNQDPWGLVGPTGGSGGSVLLIADTISGMGSIESKGGNGDGQIAANLHAAGAGGRVALHARDSSGLVGFTGTVDVAGGQDPSLVFADDGTYYTAESSAVVAPVVELIGSTEDFDSLPSFTTDPMNNTAPDRIPGGTSGSWGNAGAWGYPPTYDSFTQGEIAGGGGGIRVVDTSTIDGSIGSGHSLALRDNVTVGVVPYLFVAGLWKDEAFVHSGPAVSVEASVFVASGVGGGGIFSVANGNGATPGPGAIAPVNDMGPAIEWKSDGRLVAHQAGMAATTEVVLSTPFDAWQRVRMDIDLGADTYDLWWAPVGQPLSLVAQGLPFVTPQKRLDRFVIGQQQYAKAFYDDLVVELVGDTPPGPWEDLGGATMGVNGFPTLEGDGPLTANSPTTLTLTNTPPSAFVLAWIAFTSTPQNYFGGTIHATPPVNQLLFTADASGQWTATVPWPAGVPSATEAYFQFIVQDFSVPAGLTLSNGLKATTP